MKLKVDNELLVEAFFEDTHLLGIMATVESHRFVWQINQGMRFDFRISNELEIQLNKKNRTYFFQVFQHNEASRSLSHYLYKNHCDGEYLLPEFKHLDYLWLTKGEMPGIEEIKELTTGIRTINGVQLVVELNNEKIKHKQHLIF
jgi:hypothetical protein